MYAYPRRKGQLRMYCANMLINAARFLKRGCLGGGEAEKITGKHSGSNDLPSSLVWHYGSDNKDQHLGPITVFDFFQSISKYSIIMKHLLLLYIFFLKKHENNLQSISKMTEIEVGRTQVL